MIKKEVAESIEQRLSPDSLVLDVGGGRHPWHRANYIIDKRKYSEKIGTAVFTNDKDKKIYFSEDTWVSRDFYDLPWPFEDKKFDFVVCLNTLEDLRDPLILCREIQRVGKAGLISVPTRAAESSFGISGKSKIYGYMHHRWFIEHGNGDLIFKIKSPVIFNDRSLAVKNPGQRSLYYFWDDNFNYREEYLGTDDNYKKDAKIFLEKHRQWLKEFKNHGAEDALYNRWPDSWGNKPDFRNFAEFDYKYNFLKIFLKNIKNKLNF